MTLLQIPVGVTWNHTADFRSSGKVLSHLGAAYIFNARDRRADLITHSAGSDLKSHVLSQDLGRGTVEIAAGVRLQVRNGVAAAIEYCRQTRNGSDNWSLGFDYGF
jgi:hypothetical protein